MQFWDRSISDDWTKEQAAMATDVPAPTTVPTRSGNTQTLILSAAVAVTIAVGLIVLIALGRLTWADGGPLIGAIVGVHGGAALTAFVPK